MACNRNGVSRQLIVLALAFCGAALSVHSAWAHEIRPAYLEIRETSADHYTVLWRMPSTGGIRLPLELQLPDGVRDEHPPLQERLADSYVERRAVFVPHGLAGKSIAIAGLASTITDVLVRVEHLDASIQLTRLTPSQPSFFVEAAPGIFEVARTYVRLGIEHILTGVDHLLFILALLLITGGGWRLVKTVTAFTVSHSITLSAATLGLIHVPQAPVEAAIALSIVFVAAEIIHLHRGLRGITADAPWIVALTFGLMHGLGFAGGLSEAGLPAAHIPSALLFFSVGVETGHFLFIGAVLSLIALAIQGRSRLPHWAELIPAYGIGSIATCWFIQRSLGLLAF